MIFIGNTLYEREKVKKSNCQTNGEVSSRDLMDCVIEENNKKIHNIRSNQGIGNRKIK